MAHLTELFEQHRASSAMEKIDHAVAYSRDRNAAARLEGARQVRFWALKEMRKLVQDYYAGLAEVGRSEADEPSLEPARDTVDHALTRLAEYCDELCSGGRPRLDPRDAAIYSRHVRSWLASATALAAHMEDTHTV
jgi:hypothetical protein